MTNTGFIPILVAFVVYGAVHSLLASHQAKALAARWFGERAQQRWYRLFFNAAGAVTLLPVLALAALLPDQRIYTIPFPWALLTLAGQGLAAVGVLYAVALTGGGNFLGIEQALAPDRAAQPRQMTERGLYRYVRHPIYTCSILFLWLTPVMTWNVLAFNLGATLYMIVGALFEERKLVREFGQQYVDFQRRVPFLAPGVKRAVSRQQAAVSGEQAAKRESQSEKQSHGSIR